jgi:hypothetical protein
MATKKLTWALAFALAAGVCGCASDHGLLDKNWGRSFETAKCDQILNPDASKNTNPVSGLDGNASEVIMDKYLQSLSKEAAPPVYNINIGNLGGM